MSRLIAVVVLSLSISGFGDPVYFSNKRGNAFYSEGKYDKALEEYRKAQAGDPGSAPVDYNMANALYRLGKYGEAARAYARAMASSDKDIRRRAAFNRGVALYKGGSAAVEENRLDEAEKLLKESVSQYKTVLKEHPADNDSRHNLELALEKLEQVRKRRREQSRKDQSENNRENKNDSDNNKNKDKHEQTKTDGKQTESKTAEPDDEKQDMTRENPKTDDRPRNISREQAARIFRAMEQDERELRKKLRARQAPEAPREGRDW